MKTRHYQKAIRVIDRRMTKACGVTCHPARRYRTFESMLPVIEKKWRMLTWSSFEESYALWDDMLQEAYILCWRNWQKGQLGRDDRYITAIIRTACLRVIRKDKAVRGIGTGHGEVKTVCEWAVSDIINPDEEDTYGDSWMDRQASPDAPQCPEIGMDEKTRSLYSLNMERALGMALERLSPQYRAHCQRLAPYLAPNVPHTALREYTGLSLYQISQALRRWREAAYAVLAAH